MNSFPLAALVLINKLTKLRSLRKEIEAFHWLRNCVVFFILATAEGGREWEGQTCGSLAFSAPRFVRNFWLIKQWSKAGNGKRQRQTAQRQWRARVNFLLGFFIFHGLFPFVFFAADVCLCKFSIWIMEKDHFMPLLEPCSDWLGGNLRRTIVRGGDLA